VLGGAHRRIRIPLFELRVLAQRQAGEVIDRGWIPLADSGTKSPPSFLSKQRRTPSGKLCKFPEGVLSIPPFFVTAIEPLTIDYRACAQYRAMWQSSSGEKRSKSFSVDKYGEARAFAFAVQARNKGVERTLRKRKAMGPAKLYSTRR